MEKIIIREKYLEKIRPFYDSKYIKVITGVRRCGKSELLLQIIKEIKDKGIDVKHIIYIDLEGRIGKDITNRKKLEELLDKLITDSDKYYIFIDEIQHIKKFEEVIASIRVSYNCSLFITGSNSKLLHGKLQDRLTGRAKEFEIYPFVYSEVIEYKKANNLLIEDNDLDDYLRNGGMPQRFEEIDNDGVRQYLQNLYSSIIEKDVYGSHSRISRKDFENVSKYIISTSGRVFSALSIAKYLKDTKTSDEQKKFSETVNNYAKYLEECYFLTECRPYYLKGKEALKGAKKYYPIDVGLRSALGNVIDLDESFALESIIFNELLYRGYTVFYGKMINGEIDFVAVKGKKKCLIQVAESIKEQKAFDREYGAFTKINDNSPKYVFTRDKADTSNNGITHINIEDFLLHKVDINLS